MSRCLPSSTGAEWYGRYYWCVKTALSDDGEIYVFADDVSIEDGALWLTQRKDGVGDQLVLAFAPGQWTAVFGASCIDGHAVAVEHWAGEVAQ